MTFASLVPLLPLALAPAVLLIVIGACRLDPLHGVADSRLILLGSPLVCYVSIAGVLARQRWLSLLSVVAEHLTVAPEDPNPDVFLAAVGHVAKARGMGAIAESSVLPVLQSLGVRISVSAV